MHGWIVFGGFLYNNWVFNGDKKYWGYRRYPQYRIKNPPAVQNRRCRLHEDTCRCFVL